VAFFSTTSSAATSGSTASSTLSFARSRAGKRENPYSVAKALNRYVFIAQMARLKYAFYSPKSIRRKRNEFEPMWKKERGFVYIKGVDIACWRKRN